MDEVLNSLELALPALARSDIQSIVLMKEQKHHALYRIITSDKSFVLKWFAPDSDNIEIRAYDLLSSYGVPTLPVYGKTDNVLLMEDLNTSQAWRLATREDACCAQTGEAVAEWYELFHRAGRDLMTNPQDMPGYLRREVDFLDAPAILGIGEKLGVVDSRALRLAAEHIDALKAEMKGLPTTLNYNDFDWTNLAVSRNETSELRAIMFDYHLLGIGPAYSDYRNVVGSLEGDGRFAFQQRFGPVDEREAILDAPVSVLYSLYEASLRPQLPQWARSLLGEITSGELEAKLGRALVLIG